MNKINVLIVEDENDINNLLCQVMKGEGYDVYGAFSGSECLMYLKNNEASIILLDLMIPGISGEEVILKIREITKAPVIVISAKCDKKTKIQLLNNGADDFIEKPFDTDEVIARVNSNLRRYTQFINNDNCDNEIIEYKNICLNKENKEVKVKGKIISLTAREFKILEILIEHPNKIFSKANIFESVWEEDYLGYDNTVNVHISRLRTKLNNADEDEEYITTIWGMGYRLKNK